MKEDKPRDQRELSSTTQQVEAQVQELNGKTGTEKLLQALEESSKETQKEVIENYRELKEENPTKILEFKIPVSLWYKLDKLAVDEMKETEEKAGELLKQKIEEASTDESNTDREAE